MVKAKLFFNYDRSFCTSIKVISLLTCFLQQLICFRRRSHSYFLPIYQFKIIIFNFFDNQLWKNFIFFFLFPLYWSFLSHVFAVLNSHLKKQTKNKIKTAWCNRYNIPWMLHYVFKYLDKLKLAACQIKLPPIHPFTPSPYPFQLDYETG